MWNWFAEALRHHPEMALFLTLALGYLIGRLRFGSITLGAVVGVLIAGVIVGQLGIKVSADLKTVFFLLFLFSIGYRTGPQFFSGLKASGLPQIALTFVFCITALAMGYALARGFGYDAGTAGGLVAGGVTESATMGTATDAIGRLPLAAEAKERLLSNLAVAFAVTYFLGVLITLTFLSRIAPRILRIDLAAECRALEQQMGVIGEEHPLTGYRQFAARAYRIDSDAWDGVSVSTIERQMLERGRRLFVVRVRRDGEVVEARPDVILARGDMVALAGRRGPLMEEGAQLGPEVDDRALLDFPVEAVDVVVTSKAVAGRTLAELVQGQTDEMARGVGLHGITRAGVELPWTFGTVISRGDVLSLAGRPADLERVIRRIGYADRPGTATDIVAVGAAIFLGGMLGIPALMLGRLEVGLSESVGVLLGGLVLGWLRSVDRRFARIPEAALWLFDSVGLTAFLAVTALIAGPDFMHGLQESGLSLVVAALALVLVPQTVTLLVGRHLFKMHPGILLGVCCGAGTSAPALAAVQEAAKSKIPTLGYGLTYAVGNVLLALWGSVIVLLVH
jgi:putative transport protein